MASTPPKKLFITGATGFIGSSVLSVLSASIPSSSISITALLRAPTPAFTAAYPHIRVVLGTFDDFAIIESAAADAEIVIHTGDIDHLGCAQAIISGLKKRTQPSFLIHLSGTGLIADTKALFPEQTWEGKPNSRIWNDISDVEEIYNLPATAPHHYIDTLFQDLGAQTAGRIKTAIICPPDIYGQPLARTLTSRDTFFVPNYVQFVLQSGGRGFYLGKGENWRSVTHIADVVDLFMLLVRDSLVVGDGGEGKATWGKEGFYFGVVDEVQWKDVAKKVQEILVRRGYVTSAVDGQDGVESCGEERFRGLSPEMEKWWPDIWLYMWGSNSRAESARAKALGWSGNKQGKETNFWECLEVDVVAAAEEVKRKKGLPKAT